MRPGYRTDGPRLPGRTVSPTLPRSPSAKSRAGIQSMAGGGSNPESDTSAERAVALAVPPRAEMTLWIERLSAERAGWPAGAQERLRTLDEGTRRGSVDPDAQQVGPLVGVVGQLGVLAVVGRGLGLD